MDNTFGSSFCVTTYGESHGRAIGGIIDGCPANVEIADDFVASEMRRRHDITDGTTRNEPDCVEWLSGLANGKTVGTPIAFMIRNADVRSTDYDIFKGLYRPGHADYTYHERYGVDNGPGGGRASGRETATRVVAGAVAKTVLSQHGITITSRVEAPVPDSNDSRGGTVNCTITGVRAGYGNPTFRKLNAMLAQAMMSIPSAIGFEMGVGFKATAMTGTEFRDDWNTDFSTKTNHCGGIQGGITNGLPITFTVAFHPIVTCGNTIDCISHNGEIKTIKTGGRHDKNHVRRTAVVVEAMAAITVLDCILSQQEYEST